MVVLRNSFSFCLRGWELQNCFCFGPCAGLSMFCILFCYFVFVVGVYEQAFLLFPHPLVYSDTIFW